MIDETLMSFEEKSAYKLRSVYKKYGYLPYKMGKFEEYELYVRNKDFLISDRVIAFNDTNGKLMALKPDVTLSIIKNGEDVKGVKQKVFYNENVYRVSENTHRFKEIMQTGLECIGDIDFYDVYETICLAAESLKVFSDNFCIEISNLDLVKTVITSVCDDRKFVSNAIEFISEKNSHDLQKLCEEYALDKNNTDKISTLVSVYGERNEVLSKLKKIFDLPQIADMERLSKMLDNSLFSDKIRFDFSIVNDMNYYNGFVYRGFLDNVACGVLAGGQYDNMMKKMNRKSGAVGFAVYLDRIEDAIRGNDGFDVDYLIIYDDNTDMKKIIFAVNELVKAGFSVSAQKDIPENLRYKEIKDLRKKD